jgi:molybdopterin-synthase adenylyltransferase
MRYERNFIYISPEQQEKIKNTRILFGGVGLGSVIAETALRLGFEQFIFIDGDTVESTNLNRQNYLNEDVGKYKVEALTHRLKAINPEAKITYYADFLDENNTSAYIKDCDIAINAIDFNTDAPFIFDDVCREKNIPVIHPYNFGWAGGAFVIKPDTTALEKLLSKQKEGFELKVVNHIVKHYAHPEQINWLNEVVISFMEQKKEIPDLSPPQLSIGSSITAGIVGNLLFSLANDMPVKVFPDFYFLSTR